jgi:phospholipid/cholesterol/gamma-HCH transport system permease protein
MSATSKRPSPGRSAGYALLEKSMSTGTYSSIESAGGMAALGLRAFRLALTPPFKWWKPAIVESSKIMRRCLVPLAISLAVFVIGFGFFVLGAITKVLGATDREGGAFIIGFLRECCVWTTGMVFAGVAGSAMTADLGARKVREELDALNVLGVDSIRALVVPKVMASMMTAPILGMLGVFFVEAVNFLLAPSQFGLSHGVLFSSSKGSLVSLDIFGSLIRYVLIGIVVAVVSCYKGLNAGGGTQGVGKAVNQTIVIAFFFVWMLDALFNLAYLSLFPQSQVDFKG